MTDFGIVVIGASRGGLSALSTIAAALPAELPLAVAAVLHTSPDSPRMLAAIIGSHSAMPVSYATHGAEIIPGHLYLAPPNRHLVVAHPGVFKLDHGPKVHFSRPAADRLFESAALVFASKVIGVVLTGGDSDGAAGLRAITEAGGIGIVQEPQDAQDPSMPINALQKDHPDYRVPLEEVGPLLVRLAGERLAVPV